VPFALFVMFDMFVWLVLSVTFVLFVVFDEARNTCAPSVPWPKGDGPPVAAVAGAGAAAAAAAPLLGDAAERALGEEKRALVMQFVWQNYVQVGGAEE
jgi:hypothetical protein